jgi:hypothetical protein
MPIISNVDSLNGVASYSLYQNNVEVVNYNLSGISSMITISTVNADVSLPLGDYKADIDNVANVWIPNVTLHLNPNIIYTNNSLESISITIPPSSAADPYQFSGSLSSFNFGYSYNTLTGLFTIKKRNNSVISWGDYLQFIQFNKDFLSKIH